VANYIALFDFLNHLFVNESDGTTSRMDFENFLKGLNLDYTESRKGTRPLFIEKTFLAMAQFSVHNFCQVKSLELLKEKDAELFTIFKILHDCLNTYIREHFCNFTTIYF
jgi:hypothetical protein